MRILNNIKNREEKVNPGEVAVSIPASENTNASGFGPEAFSFENVERIASI